MRTEEARRGAGEIIKRTSPDTGGQGESIYSPLKENSEINSGHITHKNNNESFCHAGGNDGQKDRRDSRVTMLRGILNFRNSLINSLEEIVYPSNIYCLVCGSLIDRTRPYSLCDICVRELHWINGGIQPDGTIQRTCAKCGKVLPCTYHGYPASEPEEGLLCYDCMRRTHYFERGFSCLTYGLHERELMMDLKYNGRSYIGQKMGDVLFDRMIGEKDGLGIDIIIPVPISSGRHKERGYNQSEIMAKRFAERWRKNTAEAATGIDEYITMPACCSGVLIRTRQTHMLRSMNPEERVLAMEGAFEVKSGRSREILGKTVLLIDDIYTTGATADACSKTLLEAGADKVYLLTLANGGNRKPSELEKRRLEH